MAANKRKPPGRPKGVPNKLPGVAKENVIAVFTRLGGTAAMADWARENPTEFYRIYAKLVPTQTELTGSDGAPISVAFNVQLGQG